MEPIIVGNWKMRLSIDESVALSRSLAGVATTSRVIVCPSAISFSAVAAVLQGSAIALGAQLVHGVNRGAHTGGISAADFASLGATYVLVGHSEARLEYGEASDVLRAQCEVAIANGMTPILCIGETSEQRGHSTVPLEQYRAVVGNGLPGPYIVAYEPLWAISTSSHGQSITQHDVAGLAEEMRALVGTVPLLYGGSVEEENAAWFIGAGKFDGVLVGAASIQASSFVKIIQQLSAV